MSRVALGKECRDGETIIRQGEIGDCMFVVQDGKVEVVVEEDGQEVVLAELAAGDIFGEMAVFERKARSATVRARGDARVLTVDRRTLMRRFQEDPSLALKILQTMSSRIRVLDAEVMKLKERISRQTPRRPAAADVSPRTRPAKTPEP